MQEKIVVQEEAFLLDEVVKDWTEYAEDKGCPPEIASPSTHSTRFKDKIQEHFEGLICFYRVRLGRSYKFLVYSSAKDPISYTVSNLQGVGMRDRECVQAFTRFLNRKVVEKSAEKDQQQWPMSSKSLVEKLQNDNPNPMLYNTLLGSLTREHKSKKPQTDPLIDTAVSTRRSTKTKSVAHQWEGLVTGKKPAQSIALSMVTHRATGNKEVINVLGKLGHGVTYTDVKSLNKHWAENQNELPNLQKGVVTHLVIDNSDGKQQTLDGKGTTHWTNGVLYQCGVEKTKETSVIKTEV